MPPAFDEEADYRLARRVARKFKKNRAFKGWEVDDLTNELALHLWRSGRLFDPDKWINRETFAWTVMEQKAALLIRSRNTINATGWRDRTRSLDAEVGKDEGGDPLFLADVIGNGRPCVAGEAIYRVDREAALSRLSAKQREVARRMEVEGKTQSEMAEEMGLPRETFRRHYHAPIRRIEMRLAL